MNHSLDKPRQAPFKTVAFICKPITLSDSCTIPYEKQQTQLIHSKEFGSRISDQEFRIECEKSADNASRIRMALSIDALLALVQQLKQKNCTIFFESESAKWIESIKLLNNFPYQKATLQQISQKAEVVLVLGGDGTMLSTSRELASFNIPLIGINQGRVGFMTDIPARNMLAVIPAILDGYYESEQRSLLCAQIKRSGETIYQALALNDVVITRSSGYSKMIELSIQVDHNFMTKQRADGLIIATPTGSTAYALSVSGPIVHPNVKGIILAPIAPYTLSNRPIVLPDTSTITVYIVDNNSVQVNFDMQTFTQLTHNDSIVVQNAHAHVTFLHPIGHNYYATLRQKLHWNASMFERS